MITTVQQTVTVGTYSSGNAVGGTPTYASTSDVLLRITTERVYA